jgi:hypothetical protein
MSSSTLETLLYQFDLTWRLAQYHLPHLTQEVCLWEPAPGAWTVHQGADGLWRPDFSLVEPDPPPPVTIGWITWQMIWYWSGVQSAVRGETPAGYSEVTWPGSAAAATARLEALSAAWSGFLTNLDEANLERPLAYPWKEPRPLRLGAAWLNSELMKNAAEIGLLRHLYAARQGPVS